MTQTEGVDIKVVFGMWMVGFIRRIEVGKSIISKDKNPWVLASLMQLGWLSKESQTRKRS